MGRETWHHGTIYSTKRERGVREGAFVLSAVLQETQPHSHLWLLRHTPYILTYLPLSTSTYLL